MKKLGQLGISTVLLFLSACATLLPMPTPTLAPTRTGTSTRTATPPPTATQPPTPTPTPNTPTFSGRIYAIEGYDLFELEASTDPPGTKTTLIASDVDAAAISPDHRWLVYATFSIDPAGRTTHLYDLQDGTDTLLLPYDAGGFLWSPDSRRFAYIARDYPNIPYGLYLYDLNARTFRLVVEKNCGAYTAGGGAMEICGELSGMRWVSDTVMVIQRYKGEMPQTITGLGVPADTTTLLIASGGGQILVDSPQRWYVQDGCGEQVLLRSASEGGVSFSIVDTEEFISHPGSIEPLPLLSCPDDSGDCTSLPGSWTVSSLFDPYLGFFPGTCNLFYFSGDYLEPTLHLLDPQTREDRSLPFPTRLGILALPSDLAWTPDWPTGAEARVAVMHHYYRPEIVILDLESGGVNTLWEGDFTTTDIFRLLAWITP